MDVWGDAFRGVDDIFGCDGEIFWQWLRWGVMFLLIRRMAAATPATALASRYRCWTLEGIMNECAAAMLRGDGVRGGCRDLARMRFVRAFRQL